VREHGGSLLVSWSVVADQKRWFIDALLDLESEAEEPMSPGEGPELVSSLPNLYQVTNNVALWLGYL
jgi:hypothetical protein